MPLTPIQKRNVVQISIGSLVIAIGLCVVSLLSVGGIPWMAEAAEDDMLQGGGFDPAARVGEAGAQGRAAQPLP